MILLLFPQECKYGICIVTQYQETQGNKNVTLQKDAEK